MDVMGTANIVRRRIDAACRQLKPHKDKSDYCVIIIGKQRGIDIEMRDLEWAMFGDPVIRIPLTIHTGEPIGKEYFDMRVKGAFRKNDPTTRQMVFPHPYISGVGIIKELNGYRYYESQIYGKHSRGKYNPTKSLSYQIKRSFINLRNLFRKYKHTIPEIYVKDRSKSIYYVEFISNPLGHNPLPEGFFKGFLDKYQINPILGK